MAKIKTINEARVLYYRVNFPYATSQEIATILGLRVSEVENIIDYLISSKFSNRPPRFIKKTN